MRHLWIALVPGSSSKQCVREPRSRAGKAELHSVAFPLHVFIKHGGGRNPKQIISVKAEGSKGMWAGVQGCFGGAELCVCKQSTQNCLWPTALWLKFAVSFTICQTGFESGQQNSSGIKMPLLICVSKWMCTLIHTNPETPGGNKTDSVFYKPFVQLLMPWPDCPLGCCASTFPQVFAKPSVLWLPALCSLLCLGVGFSAPVLEIPLSRDTEEFIPFVQVMQKQLNMIQCFGWNPYVCFTLEDLWFGPTSLIYYAIIKLRRIIWKDEIDVQLFSHCLKVEAPLISWAQKLGGLI